MNTTALLMMITVESVVTFLTVYFFWKVLVTKPKPDNNHEENSASN